MLKRVVSEVIVFNHDDACNGGELPVKESVSCATTGAESKPECAA